MTLSRRAEAFVQGLRLRMPSRHAGDQQWRAQAAPKKLCFELHVVQIDLGQGSVPQFHLAPPGVERGLGARIDRELEMLRLAGADRRGTALVVRHGSLRSLTSILPERWVQAPEGWALDDRKLADEWEVSHGVLAGERAPDHRIVQLVAEDACRSDAAPDRDRSAEHQCPVRDRRRGLFE